MRRQKVQKEQQQSNEKIIKKGNYHNDYSPRYQEPYDIYEKVKSHMKDIKKEDKKRN